MNRPAPRHPTARLALIGLLAIVALAAGANAEGRVRPYLAENGREVASDPVHITTEGNRIRVRFVAPHAGRYRVGLAVEADTITPLGPEPAPVGSDGLDKPIVLCYPYDWTWRKQGNVLNSRPRLVMPGIEAAGTYYIMDTHELCAVRIEKTADGRVRALLLTHGFHNDGGDTATPDLNMQAGQEASVDVLQFGSIAEVNRDRFGTAPAMRGRMTQIPFRGWARRSLSREEYGRIAKAFEGVFDYVIVREVAPHDWIPPLFHNHGIRVLHYQFWGALRRHSPQVPQGTEEQLGLRGAGRRIYTAPKAPNGNWLLRDIRREEVRTQFVANATAAIDAGFDGVFLDGPAFWADTSGRRGGRAPDATCSLARARWMLLNETRTALHTARPNAILGVLGNQYYDTLGEADFIAKERMYFAWDRFAKQFDERRTMVRQDLDTSYETGQAPYAAKNVVYGVKGYSPIAVQSALHFIRKRPGTIYFGTGDFFPNRVNDWIAAVTAIAKDDSLYITSIDPPTIAIRFEGRDTIRADAACRIAFSQAVCIQCDDATEHMHRIREATLTPNRRYRILRPCPDGK